MTVPEALGSMSRGAARSKLARALGAMLAAIVVGLSWLGVRSFEGNPYAFLLFDASFLALVALALPRPRLYSYTFVALMLFLAFWMKMMMYLVFNTAFLEPTGSFDGSPQAWNDALSFASMAAIGACGARLLHLALARGRLPTAAPAVAARAPHWYPALRTAAWAVSLALLATLNALNFYLAFYQTGVNPKLVLPYHLNVGAAWLINIGFALWFACLIHWDLAHRPRALANALMAPVLEGLLSSTSALSRSFYPMHTVPYFFALGARWAHVRSLLSVRTRTGLIFFWAVGLVLSLSVVSWLRIHIYYLGYIPGYVAQPVTGRSADKAAGSEDDKESGSNEGSRDTRIATPAGAIIWRSGAGAVTPGATLANQIKPMAQQVSNLFVSRWVGLEGTLAVTAYHGKSLGFMLESLRESPTKGADSIYQKIAKSSYDPSETFTFLTLPGFVAVLAYSGSALVVLAGVAFAVLLMFVTEITGSRLTGNPFLLSVAGFAMANVLCQTNFAYLTLVFFVQLWMALIFIWGLQALPWRPNRPDGDRG